MGQFRDLLATTIVLVGMSWLTTGCGGGNSRRLLQSVSVTPASADAKNFPSGEVQFTAMGAYSQPPSPSAIPQSGWSLSEGNLADIATISQSGLAQCNSGASGTITVKASVAGPCSGTGCTPVLLSGTAQLTCP